MRWKTAFFSLWLIVMLSVMHTAAQSTDQGLLIDWHPSGTMMAYSRYYSYEVIVLDVNTNEVVNTFATSDPLFDAPQWSPDGSLLTFLDSLHSITVWSNAWDPDLANQAYYLDMLDRLQLERAAPISGFVWHPSGTSLAHSVSGTIFVWNVATDDYRQLPRSDYIYEISDLTWFDEDTLLIGDTSPAAILINAYTGELEAVFVVRGTIQIVSVSAVSPSPDRSYVALASPFGRIEIWDPTQGEFRDGFGLVSDIAVRSTFGSETRMSWVEWNPTGEYIAMADQDGLIRVWEAETLELVQEYNGLPNGSVAWSPDGTQLAFGTASGGLQIVEGPPVTPIVSCDTTIPTSNTWLLISAIMAANSAATSQTICLEEGTYTLTNHHNITTGRNGFPVISNRGRSLTIVGLGNGATISRWSSGNFRFFYVAPDGTLTLDNITLSNGYAPGNEIAGAGGAILNEGVLRIKNSILIGNRANTQAGAIYSPGVTQLEDTAILDSVANTDGGAIFTALTGRVEILRGEIRNNSANTGSGRGGAIYINGGYVRVVDALIQGNSAYTGGGIYITKSASAYSTLLQIAGGSRILENFAGAGSGGGLYSTSSGVTLISDALFSGNRTSGVGAGIWSAGVLTIRDSAFESNGDTNFGTAGAIYSFGTLSLSDARIGNNLVRSTVSGRGGGVYIAGGMASIHQTEFIGNRAGNGAGLYTINSDTTITNSTFQGNIASHNGGAINNNARITVRDSLFTQNDDAAGGEDVYSASATVHRLVATSCFVNTNPAESGVFSTTMNFDARNNWWGSSSGPFAGSPPGTGQVNGNIVYSPFVTEGCAPTTGAGVPESDQWLRLEHVCVQSDGSADVWRVTNLNSVPIVFWYRWTDSNDLGGTLEAPGNGSVEIEIERALPGSITGVGASVRIVVDDVVQAQAIVSNVPGWVQPPVCPE